MIHHLSINSSARLGHRVQAACVSARDLAENQALHQQMLALGLQNARNQPDRYRQHYVMADGISGFSIEQHIDEPHPPGIYRLVSYGPPPSDKQLLDLQKLGITSQADPENKTLTLKLVPDHVEWTFSSKPATLLKTSGLDTSIHRFDHVAIATRGESGRHRLKEALTILGFRQPADTGSYQLGSKDRKNLILVEVYQHPETQGIINVVSTPPENQSVLTTFLKHKNDPEMAIHHTGVLVKPSALIDRPEPDYIERFVNQYRRLNQTEYGQPLGERPTVFQEGLQTLKQWFLAPLSHSPFGAFIELVAREHGESGFHQPNSEQLRQQLEHLTASN